MKEKQDCVCSVAIRHQKIHTGATCHKFSWVTLLLKMLFLKAYPWSCAWWSQLSLTMLWYWARYPVHPAQESSVMRAGSVVCNEHQGSPLRSSTWSPRLQKSLWVLVCSCLLCFKRQICSDGSMSSEFIMLTVCLMHVDFTGSISRTSKSWMKMLTSVGLVTNPYFFFLLEKAPQTVLHFTATFWHLSV